MLISTVATLHDNSAHGEDNYLVRTLGDNAVLDAVMDGVTRRRGGQASQLAVDALAAAPLQSAGDVVAVLEDVNRRLYQMGWGHFWLTTVAAALCLDGTLYVVGVGDSSVFLIRPDACQQLSSRVRGAFIGARQQLVHLYRAEMALEPGDRLVLATDGVTDNVTSHELVEIVRSATSPDAAAAQLSTLITARQAGNQLVEPLAGGFRNDDWTAIVRFFSTASERASSRHLASS
jgi:serine/threonine protein phosphatase PrpC